MPGRTLGYGLGWGPVGLLVYGILARVPADPVAARGLTGLGSILLGMGYRDSRAYGPLGAHQTGGGFAFAVGVILALKGILRRVAIHRLFG